MEYHFKISEYDKIWIKTVYDKIKQNIKPTFREIRIELKDRLPRDYHPDAIDERLIMWKGTELTLLGVDFIDPAAKIKSKANLVLSAIREKILSTHEIVQIEAKEIADEIHMSESDVGLILLLVRSYGSLYNGASHNKNYYGYSSIRLDDRDDQIFEEYLFFTDIDKLIEAHFSRKEKAPKINPLKLKFSGSGPIFLEENEQGIYVNPIFKSRAQKNPSISFVVMPFTQQWSQDVFKNIKLLVESLGYQCLRADNQTGRIIMEDIWVGIIQSAFIIADVTGTNPNVMYELGIADTVGTPIILLTQDIDKIPFDLKHYRLIQYHNTLSGWEDAEQKIRNSITAIQSIEKYRQDE